MLSLVKGVNKLSQASFMGLNFIHEDGTLMTLYLLVLLHLGLGFNI
jgi:hypothetical protein